jgi:hypothetical protein
MEGFPREHGPSLVPGDRHQSNIEVAVGWYSGALLRGRFKNLVSSVTAAITEQCLCGLRGPCRLKSWTKIDFLKSGRGHTEVGGGGAARTFPYKLVSKLLIAVEYLRQEKQKIYFQIFFH